MAKRKRVKQKKPVLLLILGLTAITLIGLFFQEPTPIKLSPGSPAIAMIPAYIISAILLFIGGITLIAIAYKKNAKS
tara:strand:- start:910 stop:1140 length:231 start_codon:yes stop_codon:yes gene_type:complete